VDTIDNSSINRVNNLSKYVSDLINNGDGRQLYLKYQDDIDKVTPHEVMEIEYRQLESGLSVEKVLPYVDKLMNVFSKSLSEYKWEKPKKKTFLFYLVKENEQVLLKLEELKKYIKKQDFINNKEKLIKLINELESFDSHYQKKENILFPYFEKKMKKFNGLKIMWELHVQTRQNYKAIIGLLNNDVMDIQAINSKIGKLFFQIYGLVQKEDLILFPIATEIFNFEEFDNMLNQSYEYNFPFIEAPHKKTNTQDNSDKFNGDFLYKTDTGTMSSNQLLLVLNKLPVDITFIDEKDEVVFFNNTNDRIFKRSAAIIGRNVRNCHPPKSVHIVERILQSFKNNEKDMAQFWFTYNQRDLLITYYALRDDKDRYKGTLEVSQNITDIKRLQGEKRLIEW